MKKKIIFSLIVIIILLAIAGGFFWWWKVREIKGSPEDYVIKETEKGKFVENKKAGLSVKVPEGWKVKRLELKDGGVIFFSQDTEIKWKEKDIVLLPLKKGCIIETSIIYEDMDFIDIKLDAKYSLATLGLKSVEFEEININNYPALRIIFDTQKIGPGIAINIPQNNKVYNFNLTWGVEEEKDCIQKFDNFLKTISIK
jgi:hypothetical protein